MQHHKENPGGRREGQAAGRHVSAHLINIHEPSAPACPYAMTQRDNCGSRLLQPLVSVTKIGTQVSCHSKSSFSVPYQSNNLGRTQKCPGASSADLVRAAEGDFFLGEAKQKAGQGRKIKKKNLYTREGGKKKYVGVLGAEEDCGKSKRARARNEARQLHQEGRGRRGQLSPLD